jgi:hypothetical protein
MDSKPVPMGLGPIGSERVFPRTFRFLFISKKNPDMHYFTNKVGIDYFNKGIEISVYERVTLQTHDWIMDMIQDGYADDFTLTALDGCGEKLYILEFQGVKIAGHRVDYDYANSDVVQHKLTLGYQNMVKKFTVPQERCAWEIAADLPKK